MIEPMTTPEQQARDMLERMGVENAQSFTAGDVVELANMISELGQAKRKILLDLWNALPMHESTGDAAGSLRCTLLMSEVGDEIRETRINKEIET